jgi:hypothetical protein
MRLQRYDKNYDSLSRIEKMESTLFFLRCMFFHSKHRKRTGERRIRKVSIAYETKCEKCGCGDLPDVVWTWV